MEASGKRSREEEEEEEEEEHDDDDDDVIDEGGEDGVWKKGLGVSVPSEAARLMAEVLQARVPVIYVARQDAAALSRFLYGEGLKVASKSRLDPAGNIGFVCAAAVNHIQLPVAPIAICQTPLEPPAGIIPPPDPSAFTYCELCAGLGGFRVGLDSLGDFMYSLFASEIDLQATQTYRANFGKDAVVLGNMSLIDFQSVGPVNMVTAGFPCQPFTAAGEALGFRDGDNGKLFFQVARAIKELNADSFMLENVPNLVNCTFEGCSSIDIIVTLLQDLGYKVSWKVLDGGLLLAQRRKRLFIVGFKENVLKAPFRWPVFPRLDLTFGDIAEDAEVERTLLTPEQKNVMKRIPVIQHGHQTRTIMGSYKNRHRMFSQFVKLSETDYAFMTPREIARLQGFPNHFVLDQLNTANRIYTQLGNAVPPPMVAAVGAEMLLAMGRTPKENAALDLAKQVTNSRRALVNQ